MYTTTVNNYRGLTTGGMSVDCPHRERRGCVEEKRREERTLCAVTMCGVWCVVCGVRCVLRAVCCAVLHANTGVPVHFAPLLLPQIRRGRPHVVSIRPRQLPRGRVLQQVDPGLRRRPGEKQPIKTTY